MGIKEEIIALLSSINREGIDDMVAWLVNSTYFTMPSSTKFHGNYDGGLAEHSLNVYNCLKTMCDTYKKQFPETEINEDSLKIIALCHDFCKIDLYKKGFRNVKNEVTGQWEKKQIFEFDDTLGMGHGEASVYIAQSFIKLTREEALAIRWHMGGYDTSVKGGERGMYVASKQTPLVTLIQFADMWASNFMEKVVE